jgi:hypothetical protein
MIIQYITEQQFITICKEIYKANRSTINRFISKEIDNVVAKIEILNALRLHLRGIFDISIDAYQYSQFQSGTEGEVSAIGWAILEMLKTRRTETFDIELIIYNELLAHIGE